MYKQRSDDDDGDHKQTKSDICTGVYIFVGVSLEANTILQLTAKAEELIVRFTVVFVLS